MSPALSSAERVERRAVYLEKCFFSPCISNSLTTLCRRRVLSSPNRQLAISFRPAHALSLSFSRLISANRKYIGTDMSGQAGGKGYLLIDGRQRERAIRWDDSELTSLKNTTAYASIHQSIILFSYAHCQRKIVKCVCHA